MSQIDLIYAKSVEEQLGRILPQLEAHHKKIIDISKTQIDFFGGKTAKSPADLGKVETQYNKIVGSIEKTRLAEIKLQQAREKAFDKYEAQLNKEQAKLKASENLYNKAQAKLNALQNEYKGLATKKELGLKLSKDEEKSYARLQTSITKYDTILKAVDATMGKHQRNVGNYASGFNVLGNSVNQLTREMPAFANSVQTGFMAISNNLPVFFDAIAQTNRELKQMRAEGKQVPSLLSKIAGSIFSVGTLLSATVTILTLFGPKLVEAFTGGSEAIDKFNENVTDVNATTTETAVKLNVVQEALNNTSTSQKDYNSALKIAQQEGISLNAIEEARKGNLKLINEEIEKQIDLSIRKAKADKLVNLIAENEIEQLKQAKKNSQAYTGFWNKALSAIPTIGYYANAKRRESEKQTLKDLENQNAEYYKMLRELGLESLVEDEKVKKEKTKKEHDYLKDKYDARLSELELELQVIDMTLNNEDTLADTRLTALELHRKKRNEILTLQYNEEMRLAKDNQDLQLVALNKYHSESLKVIEEYAQKEIEINKTRLQPIEVKLMADNQAELAKNIKKATDEFLLNAQAMKDNEERMRKLKEITDAYLTTFQSDFFNQAGFPTLFKILNDEIIGFGTNWAVTFNAMGEVAQEAFRFIEQASTQRFEKQKAQLNAEYELSTKLAGDNAEAKAEIDRQYEAKLREIRIREFKAKKRLAIVEANINIAQGVIASLAKGGVAGIVMAGVIGALGIAQLLTIQNQEMPEYWTGTENAKEGLAKTQERGREFIFDKSGKLKSTGSDKGTTITKMEAGDKVWNADKTRKALDAMMFNDQLNNILSTNGILSPIVDNRLNDERIVNALNSVESAINNKSYEGVKLDENGIKKYISNGQTTTYLTNNRRNFKPRQL